MKKNRTAGIFSVIAGLIKLKLSLAVVLSSVTGYYMFSNAPDKNLFFLIIGIFLLASGSATLNQYTERTADAMMERTKNRPIPSGKITEKSAIQISSLFFTGGCLFLYLNGTTALILGIINVLLYNLVYTRLKKLTILSIIPGALVGAIPPVIGFTSAGGNYLNHRIIAFSIFMFLWQLPHFWLILMKYGKDYKAAGFPTIHSYLNDLQIRNLVFIWVMLSTVFLFLFFFLAEPLNRSMFILLSLLNLIFIITFYRLLFTKSASREIKSAFILINSFSIAVMLLLITLSILKGS
jgi:heme o synthase